MNCALHKNKPLTLFCQTCLDAICVQCRDQHPHSDQFHTIKSLQESANTRRQFFDNFVTTQINPIKQKIGQKLKQLKSLQESKLMERSVILKDIMLQFQNIQGRVKQNEYKKGLQLQTQIKYFEDYLNTLDDLAYSFQKTMKDPYNFLILYKDFNKLLQKLESKLIVSQSSTKTQWLSTLNNQKTKEGKQIQKQEQQPFSSLKQIVESTDLQLIPRQIKQTHNYLLTLCPLQQRNSLVNTMLIKAASLYKQQVKKTNSFGQNQTKRILHIYNQANKNVFLLKTAKTCCYCQAAFSIDACNDQCSQNKSFKSQLSPNYSHILVPIQNKGSKRHYWVDSQICNRKKPDATSHTLVRNKIKKQFLNSLQDLRIIQCCFRTYQIEKKEDFIKAFQKEDKQSKKNLSKIKFKYILTKIFQMKQIHSQLLLNLLWKDQQIKIEEVYEGQQRIKKQTKTQAGVYYQGLIQLVKNPLILYYKYLEEEQHLDKSKPIAPQSMAKKYIY